MVSTTDGGLDNLDSNHSYLNTLCGGINLILSHQRFFYLTVCGSNLIQYQMELGSHHY